MGSSLTVSVGYGIVVPSEELEDEEAFMETCEALPNVEVGFLGVDQWQDIVLCMKGSVQDGYYTSVPLDGIAMEASGKEWDEFHAAIKGLGLGEVEPNWIAWASYG